MLFSACHMAYLNPSYLKMQGTHASKLFSLLFLLETITRKHLPKAVSVNVNAMEQLLNSYLVHLSLHLFLKYHTEERVWQKLHQYSNYFCQVIEGFKGVLMFSVIKK